MNDYRILGTTPSAVLTDATITAPTGGFMVVIALTDLVITNFEPTYIQEGITSLTAFTLPKGVQKLAVKAMTFTGTADIYYFL